jgi:hypothetical protein
MGVEYTAMTTIGMAPSVDELGQQQAIKGILFRHSRGLDRGDGALLKSLYWPEAEVDYGSFKGSAHQFSELIGPALEGGYELTQHNLGQCFIEINGDAAKAESYVTARHLLIGAKEEMIFSGRYLDQLECRDGRWKLIHRRVVMDWGHSVNIVDERNSEVFSALSKGGRGQQDPAFNFFS